MYNVIKIIEKQIADVNNSLEMDSFAKSQAIASYTRSLEILKKSLHKFFVYPADVLSNYKFLCYSDLRTYRTDFHFEPLPKWTELNKSIRDLTNCISYLLNGVTTSLTYQECATALNFLYLHKENLGYEQIKNYRLEHTQETIRYLEEYYKHLTGECYAKQ